MHIPLYPTFLDTTLPFVYNYKPENFEEDFIRALSALVTAQDDPQGLEELNEGAKSILNDYQNELPYVLRQVKLNYIHNFTFIVRLFTLIDKLIIGNANL